MKYTIDRFEGTFAVCEDEQGTMINISIDLIPQTATEGDVLIYSSDRYAVDTGETNKRKKNIQNLMDELWQK